jgi:NADH-quinone oxidoreductase subunit G
MPKLSVNGKEVEFDQGMTVLQACEIAGEEIPRFCYHERLKIAGNCRMCLVQIEGGPPKPAASCAMPAADGMKVHTNTPMVKKAREGVMEFLLINHPLDCPICDQGGECDLQDQAMAYGKGSNRFDENKRAVKDKYMGPVIKTHMTRCIHCTRCIRFMEDVAGVPELGATSRGEKMEVGTYIEKGLSSELSGNIVDLCPVGALTSKPYAFKARPWELTKTETIDVSDAVGSNIRADSRGNEVVRIMPILNEEINEEWISDKTRFIFEGLKYQRLDKPYIRKKGRLQPASWEEALSLAAEKIKKTAPSKIAAIAGDLVDCESVLSLKSLLDDLDVTNYDCRQDGALYDSTIRASYIFNTTIAGIEEADSVLIIGSNPRYEASLVNSRIRKNVVNNDIPVALIGDEVDLTYKYEYLGGKTDILDDILDGKEEFSKVLKNSENPLIIIGNDIYKRKDAGAIISKLIRIAEKYDVVRADWNGLSALQKHAGRVGALDLGFVPQEKGKDINEILKSAKKGDIELVYLLGADEIEAEEFKDSFVIYQGHHGDRGAHAADIILPGAAYTEKDATYVNLEGRPQKAYRATFPVGDAREDWQIIAELAKLLKVKPFRSLDDIREKMADINEIFENIDDVSSESWPSSKDVPDLEPSKMVIKADKFNFYFTDPISRVSKTLIACDSEFAEEKGFKDKKNKVA